MSTWWMDCKNIKKTSLKAFSHQRRAKSFNTLINKADSFEKKPFLAKKKHFWPKSHFKFDKTNEKAVKPLLPKSHFCPKSLIKFDPFLTDLIQKIKNKTLISILSVNATSLYRTIFWLVRNPIWSSLIKFDPFWTDLIQKNQKWNGHFYSF